MEKEPPIQLSLEQQFNLRAFEEHIKGITLEQAQILLSDLHRQLLVREAYFKHFIRQSLLGEPSPEID
ncbi:MAG: NblA-related protein [Symploca sp. SIO3C6]|uniref:NblA-related protein n=1 Tax=Symploca sp. SIO1C4 TaxID=2607765 RepID=A0A6B3NCW4_9CYAN|nr:NblA-related protein [Symploca sp. SIO3C6]NER28775.1 NblA-related protein [Symploca sp. SIO1C4]NET04196.1 NblA-related protein [Symploca sp. SIO2B6]NET54059.1 NblA-related protein [Merismopedia sp. SIO2A8]